jgi:hypothetical protein
MRIWALAVSLLLIIPNQLLAQSPFAFSITNVGDIPLGGSHVFRINLTALSPTSYLFSEGLNSIDFGLRMKVLPPIPPAGSVSTVNAVPTIGTSVTDDIQINPAFPVGTFTFAYQGVALDTISGYTNIVGFSLAAPFGFGLQSATSVFIADIRLQGDILGAIELQAFTAFPSQAGDPVPNGNIFTTARDIGVAPFGPTDPGIANFNVIAAIPEPTTWALIILSIASGIGGLVYFKRHHLQSAEKQLQLAQEGAGETE